MNSSNSSEPISSHASVVRRIAQALPAPSAAVVHIGTGGWFARALLLANALDAAPAAKKILCFFVTDEDMRRFAKFFSAHSGRGVASVDSAESLAAAISADRGVFALQYSALRAKLPTDYDLRALTVSLSRGDRVRPVDAIERLLALGYRHDPDVTVGTYRLDGDTLHVRSFGSDFSASVSFFGDEVDDIMLRPAGGTGALETLKSVSFAAGAPADPAPLVPVDAFDVAAWSSRLGDATAVFFDPEFSFDFREARERFASWYAFAVAYGSEPTVSLGIRSCSIDSLSAFSERVRSGAPTYCLVKQPKSVERFLDYSGLGGHAEVAGIRLPGIESFDLSPPGETSPSVVVIADDVAGEIFFRPSFRPRRARDLGLLLSIAAGDHVVHVEHGIGLYEGKSVKTVGGVEREYLHIRYAGGDLLSVPIEEASRLTKYVGAADPVVSSLGGTDWKKKMRSAEEDAEEVAKEILENHARRSLRRGFAFSEFPEKEKEFRESFRAPHTADQARAIAEVLADMAKETPMDRLVTGDVGFGKTEVAMNAVYRAFLSGKQSVFLSPLVVLAYDHYETAVERLGKFGVRVAVLTRLTPASEARRVIAGIRAGKIDLVIGTHRLLSEDMAYANPGLLVIDEEHRFGVMDKEKIHALKWNLDVLSLSATPIPRSLNMALSGLTSFSILATAPRAKKPIRTLIAPEGSGILAEAIAGELDRGGQILVVTPRIESIAFIREEIVAVAPDLRVVETHGQLAGTELEDRIMDFKNRKYDCLLSTTVIENGVNFLSANTVIIYHADRFGLSQLHQLRGRVGRADVEGRCHLLYPRDGVSADAKERLSTLVANSHLGAGFEIAMRDLEIRGAGDILGVRQSGKTHDVGISLYLEMLESKINELKAGPDAVKSVPFPSVDLNIPAYVPDEFFASDREKLAFFRNIESLETEDDLVAAREHVARSHDALPETVENLFRVLAFRIWLRSVGVSQVRRVLESYVVEWHADHASVERLRELLERDVDRRAVVASGTKIKFPTRTFKSDLEFLKYLSTEDWQGE